MDKYIVLDIVKTIKLYLPISMIIGMAITLAFYFIRIILKKAGVRFVQKIDFGRAALICVLFAYTTFVIYITYFSREPGSRNSIDLKFLSTYSSNPQNQAYVIENILLFIPFGFVFPLLWKSFKSFKLSFLAMLAGSLTIEISQLVSKRGYFQVDDIVFNVAGGILGYMICYILLIIIEKHKRVNCI